MFILRSITHSFYHYFWEWPPQTCSPGRHSQEGNMVWGKREIKRLDLDLQGSWGPSCVVKVFLAEVSLGIQYKKNDPQGPWWCISYENTTILDLRPCKSPLDLWWAMWPLNWYCHLPSPLKLVSPQNHKWPFIREAGFLEARTTFFFLCLTRPPEALPGSGWLGEVCGSGGADAVLLSYPLSLAWGTAGNTHEEQITLL